MGKIDTTKLIAALKDYQTHMSPESMDKVIKMTNEEGKRYFEEGEAKRRKMGEEFVNVTSDRNNMSVAGIITPSIVQSLLKSIDDGTYK